MEHTKTTLTAKVYQGIVAIYISVCVLLTPNVKVHTLESIYEMVRESKIS